MMTATTATKRISGPAPIGGAFARGLRTRTAIQRYRLDAIRRGMSVASLKADEVCRVVLLFALIILSLRPQLLRSYHAIRRCD